PKAFYQELTEAAPFREPTSWSTLQPADFDALLLPGGHAPEMRQYLGSEVLHAKLAAFWKLDRPVAAICHGVLPLARARDPESGASLIAKSRTTCLPKYMERASYLLTFWKLGRHYRTYPLYVEDEIRAQLVDPSAQFVRGPRVLTRRGT